MRRKCSDFRTNATAIAFTGKDSDEVCGAGGIRKSERKRPRPRTVSSATGSENEMTN
ncbi:MAG: hypothetical protein IPJ13_23475 [Saprospiraceae bacterium]|nr:hypothetical protein [Saprospiraceae bacterium]